MRAVTARNSATAAQTSCKPCRGNALSASMPSLRLRLGPNLDPCPWCEATASTRLVTQPLHARACASQSRRASAAAYTAPEPPAARHWPHRPARSALIKRAGRRAEVNVVWYVVRALPVPLSMFRLRAVSWVPVRYVLRSLFEIHIATHASLQYAEHVRQVCKRTATECANRLTAVACRAFGPQAIARAHRPTTGRSPLCLWLGRAWHGMASDRIESGVQALNALVQSEVIGKCVSFRDSQGYHYRCRATLPGRGPMLTCDEASPSRGTHALTHTVLTHLRAHADTLCVWRSRTSLGTGGAALRANRLRRCMAHQSRRRGVCACALPEVVVHTVPPRTPACCMLRVVILRACLLQHRPSPTWAVCSVLPKTIHESFGAEWLTSRGTVQVPLRAARCALRAVRRFACLLRHSVSNRRACYVSTTPCAPRVAAATVVCAGWRNR